MKTAIYLIISVLCLCASCTTYNTKRFDKEAVIVIDITDPLTLTPDEQGIFAFLGLKDDIWQGIRITVTSISEMDNNPERVIVLPQGSHWLGNSSIRQAQGAKFKREVTEHINSLILQAKTSQGHSIIYRTLAKQLTCLITRPAKKHYLFVYSNFMENDSINFYNHPTFTMLKTCPISVQRNLEKEFPFPNVHNVLIYCFYSPTSYEDGKQYMVASGCFKQIIKSHGGFLNTDNSLN